MELIAFIVLIIFSSFFSASETAFFSIPQSRVRLLVAQKVRNAKIIEKLKKDSEKLLITILIGNNIVNIFAASISASLAITTFNSIGLGIITGITTIIILLFGEIIPKSVAYANNVNVAKVVAIPLFLIFWIFKPITFTFFKLNTALNKLLKSEKNDEVTEEEIRIMSRIGVERGMIDYDEHRFIENIFKFDHITVGSVMTPLPRVYFIDGDDSVEKVSSYVSQTEHSRYPVYIGDTDNIIGYIHVNAIMKALNSDGKDKKIQNFARPIKTIDEEMSLERTFRSMNKSHAHMYLVHEKNKPESILGLVTLEDILESLVGEIEDETDLPTANH